MAENASNHIWSCPHFLKVLTSCNDIANQLSTFQYKYPNYTICVLIYNDHFNLLGCVILHMCVHLLRIEKMFPFDHSITHGDSYMKEVYMIIVNKNN